MGGGAYGYILNVFGEYVKQTLQTEREFSRNPHFGGILNIVPQYGH